MGSSLSAEQENALLEAFDHVVLLLGGDAAGRAASRALAAPGCPGDVGLPKSKCRTAPNPINYRS